MELLASPRSDARNTSSPLRSAESLEESRGDGDFDARPREGAGFILGTGRLLCTSCCGGRLAGCIARLAADDIGCSLRLAGGALRMLRSAQRLKGFAPLIVCEAVPEYMSNTRQAEM